MPSELRTWNFRRNDQAADVQMAEVLIYEDIGEGFFGDGLTAKTFREELLALGEIDELNVRINSAGGFVDDGLAIYNTLREHSAKIIVDIDGLAASIASVIAMAGDTIRMADNARLMVHEAWAVEVGPKSAMLETAERLGRIDAKISAIYSRKSSATLEAINQMMIDETWLDAGEAQDLGFVHEVTGEQLEAAASAAKFDLSRFHNVPAELRGGPVPAKRQELDEAARRSREMGVRIAAIKLDDFRR